MIRKLSLKDEFGQMILLGLDVYDINDEIISLIKEYHIGGVVLYKKNYTSIDNMIEFINKLKEINNNGVPLFIAIDQENGRVNRFPKDVERIYNPFKQANTKDINVINEINKITTYLMKSVGVNMNFAPVLDICLSEFDKAIGNRSYGKTKEDVINYAIPFMKEMQNNQIISVVKHFPGHGATHKDSHFVLPKIRNIASLEKEDMKVFDYAINNGADAIMVGHLVLKGYGNKPASLNKKIIQKYIYDKYNYKGLLITDDLRMGALRIIRRIKNNIKKSVEAGNNVIMIKYKKGDLKMYKKLFKMVENCEIDPVLINNSCKKIMRIKKEYNLTNELVSSKLNLEKINKRIKLVNEYIDKY